MKLPPMKAEKPTSTHVSLLFQKQVGLNCKVWDVGNIFASGCQGLGDNVKYCADPIDGELVFVADNTLTATVEDQGIKLIECQGDCDQDWDCDVSEITSAIRGCQRNYARY
jgi:hypothetical protein